MRLSKFLDKSIIWSGLRFRWQADTAHFGSNWTNMMSTFAFTAVAVSAILITFQKIDNVAGLDQNQVIFIMFVTAIAFYFSMVFMLAPCDAIATEIRNGKIDTKLTMPISVTKYMMSTQVSLLMIIRDTIIPQMIYVVFIDWKTLNLELGNLLLGSYILLVASIIDLLVGLTFAYSTVWHGSDSSLLRSYQFTERSYIYGHWDILPSWFKFTSLTFLPAFMTNILAASVMLGLANGTLWSLAVTSIFILVLIIYKFTKRLAISSYGSASS